jgi:ArsR family transcriptional regulator
MGRGTACAIRAGGGKEGSSLGPGRTQNVEIGEFVGVAKALSDEKRVRILVFLREGELCVCQIIEMLGLAPSTISEHMAVLHRAGLVEARKEGRWIYYRLAGADASDSARIGLRWVRDSLANDALVLDDARRLRAVKRTPVRELCRCYKA